MGDVVMPRLSDAMEEGTILKWLLADGAHVRPGDELAEIEIDKATTTCAAAAEGTLEIVAAEGETLRVGAVIARIVDAVAPATGAAPEGGDGGARPTAGAPVGAAAPAATATAKGATTVEEPTRAQQLIARRVAESRATVPDFTISVDVDMQACAALRERLRARAAGGVTPPTYNDLIVKACALALREHPLINGGYRDAKFERHSRVNVGVTVAAERAFLIPTIVDADTKRVEEIARETRTLADRVRSGEITSPELSGATFTVSNLGMHGVRRFTAVIIPPQAAVLAVGAIAARAVVRDGAVVPRPTMDLTLACDQRVVYGTDAAAFLARVRALLEEPLALVA